ncbi:MAG: heme lyase CcmF/NrfE family subunit [Burkholderiaceae bacterium]
MIAELGQFCLAFALAIALVASVFGFWHISRQSLSFSYLGRALAGSAWLTFALTAAAFGALIWSFITSDFSVRNVAENSNSLLPMAYRFAASWGSHEGSLLLWVLMLSGWTAAVAGRSAHLAPGFRARVIATLLLLQVAFVALLLASSNPFLRLLPAAIEGRDLNPLLQDPVMVIHPPMLYMGYVGFAVTFAFAVAALLEGRLDPIWARWSRPWANAAWVFLTVGILLGSWWAYTELGWGGWWFWDPVENASILPWFAGTALIHSLAVTDKRDALKSWTVLLALIAFALSLLGTFLVRSGVLTSVHAFATDPTRGILILSLLTVVVGVAFVLYAWRTREVGLGGSFSPVSRESLLLINNLLLACALSAVLLGTLYPLIMEAIGGTKMSVGPPYFEAVIVPLLLPAAWFMASAPWSTWKSTDPLVMLRQMLWPLLAAVAVAAGFIILRGKGGVMMALGIISAALLAIATLSHAVQRLRGQDNVFKRMRSLGASYWAMVLAHMGVAVFIAGVTLVKTYEIEKDLVMRVGQTETIANWTLRFDGVKMVPGQNYSAWQAMFQLAEKDGSDMRELLPEKRRYAASGQTMSEAAIDYGVFGDIYLSLGEPMPVEGNQPQVWSARIYLKPFIGWIWWGCMLMALGGALALFDRRYRRKVSA